MKKLNWLLCLLVLGSSVSVWGIKIPITESYASDSEVDEEQENRREQNLNFRSFLHRVAQEAATENLTSDDIEKAEKLKVSTGRNRKKLISGIASYLSTIPNKTEKKRVHTNLVNHFDFGKTTNENGEELPPTPPSFDGFWNKVKSPVTYPAHYLNKYIARPVTTRVGKGYANIRLYLPRLAHVAGDAYLDRAHMHSDADALSSSDQTAHRWTSDGRRARTAQFLLRKALAGRDAFKTVQSNLTEAGPFSNAQAGTAFARLLMMAINMAYQGWTRKRARLTQEELKDLAAYNYHVGATKDVEGLQNEIKRSADWLAGMRTAGDGVLSQINHEYTQTATHGLGISQEIAEMSQRYRTANTFDKVRKTVREWRAENPDLQAPQEEGPMGGLGALLGGSGQGGGMSQEQLMQMLGG